MFVVVGEALVDLIGKRGGRVFTASPGGSPANVALGLARLGPSVTLNTLLGRDAFGEMITAHLEASGVVVAGSPAAGRSTSLAIAMLDADGASYDFRIDWDLKTLPSLPAGARCLHTGSLATVLPPGDQAVLDLMRRERHRGVATISYDPNIRPSILGDARRARPQVEATVALADVVKVSDEDLHWLYDDQQYQDIARRWLAMGPVLVVVTRGGAGAYAVSRAREVTQPAVPVEVVDTVGAGDAYMAGLLDGLHVADLLGGGRREALTAVDEPTIVHVLNRAAVAAAITCSRPGADPPTRQEVDDLAEFNLGA